MQQLQAIRIAAAVMATHISNSQINNQENEFKFLKEQFNEMTQHRQEESKTKTWFWNYKDTYYKMCFSYNKNT